jgi:AcrR family transcriptional regulator
MMMTTAKRHPGRPKDDELHERRREQILDEAARRFAEHGYPNTDVQWIADALSVAKGTVYHYFPSKAQLFREAVRRGVGRLHQHVERATAGMDGDPLRLMEAAIGAYLEFFGDNPQLVELFVQERAEFKDRVQPVYFEHKDARRGPWRKMVAALIAAGRVRDVPPDRVLDVMGDLLYGTIFTNHLAGRGKSTAAQSRDILDLLFYGILSESERAVRTPKNMKRRREDKHEHR